MANPAPAGARRGLLRVLGASFALAVGIGATIGAGILRTPGEVAAHLPNTVLFMAAWVLGGINALMGATAYSELAAMMPQSGGPYVYVRRALGPLPGFFAGYSDWINQCASLAAIALLVGEYIPVLAASLSDRAVMTAAVVLGGLAVLQWVGVRSAGRLQEVTTVVKALALLAVAAAAFFVVPAAPGGVVEPREASVILAFALAMQGVLFTYDSYYWMVYYGEDLTAPERDIPRSMFRGLAVIIAVYLLLNLAFLRLLPMEQLAGASFAGGALAAVIFGQHGDAVIRGIMIISLLGALNAQLLAAPRILYAMAGDRLFPSRGLAVSARGTLSTGLAVTLAVTALFLLSGTFTAVLAAIAVIIVVNYVLIYASLFVLRRREPDAPRPYRAWGYPWVQSVAFVIALAFLVGVAVGDPRGTLLGAGVLAAAAPVYLLVARFSR